MRFAIILNFAQMIPGFSWAKSVGPKLPKLADGSCPQWCPATHFGYQTQGTCKIKFEDGTETTINARRGVLEAASTSARRRMGRYPGVLEPSESRVHLHAIDATSARSRGIYNTRRPRDALIDVLRRPATATSWTSRTSRKSSATRRSSCTSSRSR